MRKTYLLSIVILALILSACSSQAAAPETTEAPAVPAATETPAAFTAPTEEGPAPTATTTEEAPAPGGSVTYTIAPAESKVTYEVGEVFLNQDNRFNTAVGVTQGVSGEIQIDFENPQNSSLGPITIDISQFTSDSSRRDNFIRDRFLESARYPIATFVANRIEGLPESVQFGQPYALTILGDLTVREITKPVTFETNVSLTEDGISGQAVTTLLMSDYGAGPIEIAGILKTEDEVRLIFDFIGR